MNKRATLILLAIAGLVVIVGISACSLVTGGAGCKDCPTFKYFRLET